MGNQTSKQSSPTLQPWNEIEAELWRHAYMADREFKFKLDRNCSKERFEETLNEHSLEFNLDYVGYETWDYTIQFPQELKFSLPMHKMYLESCQFENKNQDLEHIRKIMELDFLIDRATRNGDRTCQLDVSTETDGELTFDEDLYNFMCQNISERALDCRLHRVPYRFNHRWVIEVTV